MVGGANTNTSASAGKIIGESSSGKVLRTDYETKREEQTR